MRCSPTFLLTVAFLSSHYFDPRCAVSAPSTENIEEVGHRQEWIQVPETGRSFPVDVFFPLRSDRAALLPPAEFTFYVPRPDVPGGLFNISEAFNFHVTGSQLASAIGSDLVRATEDPDIGQGRAIVFLPGGNGPGFAYMGTAVELARRGGFVVFLATLPFAPNNLSGHCLRQSDSEAIVDFISGHPEYGRLEELHGMGHSLGGQNWIARLSEAQLCNLSRETRVQDAVLLDGTWESTSLAQTSHLQVPTLVFSQQCRFSQMLLQIEIPSNPVRIDLEGFLADPLTGNPIPLGSGNSVNHGVLFSQSCQLNQAIREAGGPAPPGAQGLVCQLSETIGIERRSLAVVWDYTEAFFNHFSKGRPKRWPPGGQPEELYAHLIPEAPEQSGEPGAFTNYCFNVPGQDPEAMVEVDFLLGNINIPRQF
ncbi:MAG TPA: hypothetical protein VJP40_07475 [bacterium]|nr:hypothetical protein [bacterium]